jgi:hypothetical protein
LTTVTRATARCSTGVADLERVTALLANRDLYTLLDGYPEPDRTRGGRPQIYPDWLLVAYGALRAVETAPKGPIVWDFIRDAVRQQFPNDPSRWLPDHPPSRTWYVKRKQKLKGLGLEPLREAFTLSAVAIARELGLLDPDGAGSLTHPDPARMIHCDGKAIRQMYNGAPGDTRDVIIMNSETGEVTVEQRPVRADPDAKVHITGDNRQIHGSKHWHVEVRDSRPQSRVFLAVDHAPTEKDANNSEADIAVKNLLALAPHVDGAHGVLADTVLRGTHIDQITRATGWIVINPVTAKAVDQKTRERTEKQRYLRTETFYHPDGRTENVDIWTIGGGLVRIVHTDDGTPEPVPLERIGNINRKNQNGEWRAYVEYLVPDPYGIADRKIREPILQNDTDTFNRPELIRQIPVGDPDYDRLIGRRSDAESANRGIDDDLYLRRAASLGAAGQLFDLICHAFLQNSIARYRHGPPGAPPPAIAA